MWIQKTGAGVRTLTFSPDARTLYVYDTRGNITAWETATHTPKPLFQINPVDQPTPDLSVACDGQFLVLRLLSTVHIHDAESGAEHAQVPIEPNSFAPVLDRTRRLLVTPDLHRDFLATYDIAARTPGPPLLSAEAGTTDRFGAFAQTADGNIIAVHTAQRDIVVYDRSESRWIARFVVSPLVGLSWVSRLEFTADGNTLAIFAYNRVALWDVPSRTARSSGVVCYRPTSLAAVHPTLPLLAARNQKKEITLFSLDTGEPVRSLDFGLGKKITCVAFSFDGLTCAVGGSNKQFAVFDVDV